MSYCNNFVKITVSLIILFTIYISWYMGLSSSKMNSPAAIINATTKQTASVIFLHGLGDQGRSWKDCFLALKQPHVKYIFPDAPVTPVAINGGMKMPSWFNLYGLSPDSKEDEEGIQAAATNLHKIVNSEEEGGIARNRIVIGGFSQGGALALYSAFGCNHPPIGGVIALSSWLPLHKKLDKFYGNQNTPCFQCHGKEDMMVPYLFGQMTHSTIKKYNNHPLTEFKAIDEMGHHSTADEMSSVKSFLDKVIPPV